MGCLQGIVAENPVIKELSTGLVVSSFILEIHHVTHSGITRILIQGTDKKVCETFKMLKGNNKVRVSGEITQFEERGESRVKLTVKNPGDIEMIVIPVKIESISIKEEQMSLW